MVIAMNSFINSFAKRAAVVSAAALLFGCATADKKPLVQGPTTTLPSAADAQPANTGSLFPASASSGARFRPLFADQRARQKGDVLTVLLNERTVANRSSRASAEKSSEIEMNADLSPLTNLSGVLGGLGTAGRKASNLGKSVDGVAADGAIGYSGKGDASAQNAFTGTVTVTVMDVLPNGNLVIAGEKQLAVSSEEEVIRVSGVVNPEDLANNTVSSTRVADLRLEYRGRGFGDDTSQPGWLTRAFMKISPF